MIREKDLKDVNVENLKIFLIEDEKSKKVSSQLKEFAKYLANYLPLKIEIKKEELPAYPALKLTDKEEKIKIYYMAVPERLEWEPFLNALKAVSEKKSFLNEDEISKIKELTAFVEIKVFITPFCPFCPAVVDKINQLSIAQNLLKTFIIDATLYPELSQKYKVTASPTVVINEEYFLVGEEAKKNLLNFIEKAGKATYDKEVLKNLLKQAQAEKVIQLCERDEKCLFSLLELLSSPELFTRIGVMRVLEEMAEKRKIPEKILFQLMEMLKNAKDERDKGDILYLLGLIGIPEIVSEIEKAIENETLIVKEIGKEAIESIRKRAQFH